MTNKSTFIILFLFLIASVSIAQITTDTILEIEESTDSQKNIRRLESILKSKGLNKSIKLQAEIQLANNFSNLQEYDKATRICQTGVLTAKQEGDQFAEASFYLCLGRTYYNLKLPNKVSQYTHECLKIAEVNNYTELLKRSNHNLGVIELEKNKYDEAEKYFLKAIEYANQLPRTIKDNPGRNYRLLATNYNYQKKNDKADSAFAIAEKIFEELHDSLGLIEVLIFRAGLLKSQKKYDQALALSLEAVNRSRKTNTPDHIQTALSILHDVYVVTDQYKEANKVEEEIFMMEVEKGKNTLNKELADSEVRFNLQELKNQEKLREIETKQRNQFYVFIFILILISSSAFLIMFFQRKISTREQEMKLNSLQEVHHAAEQERSRIAKDLHDNMGAYTTSLLAQIDQLEGKKDPLQQQQQISTLRIDAENIMATLRETIWILKAGPLESQKFVELLKNYAAKNLKLSSGIDFDFKELGSDSVTLRPVTSLNLYRIFQEIIQNIIKHSQASHVSIITNTNGLFSIEVNDNGSGFELDTLRHKSGLDNMNFRAKEIGYKIHISSDKNGTTIFISELIENEY
jgi:signal transduction histidine kinase